MDTITAIAYNIEIILMAIGFYLIFDGIISIAMRTNKGKWYYEPGRILRAAFGVFLIWIVIQYSVILEW